MDNDERYPICPICDEEAEEIFFDLNHEVCGCDKCITSRDAWEWLQDQIDDEERVKADYYLDYLKDMRCDNE